MYPLLLSLLVIAIGLLYKHLTRNFDYWRKRSVPYFKPVLLFGNVWNICIFKVCIGDFVWGMYKTATAPFQGFFVFDQPFLFVRDPELCKLVLIKDVEYFDERTNISNERDDPLGSSLLFVLKNPVWRSVRTAVSPIFSAGKVKNMFRLILEPTAHLLDYLNIRSLKQQSVDCRDVGHRYTTDVIASCAFGIKSNAFFDEDDQFREVTRRLFEWNIIRKLQMACYFVAPMMVKLFRMKFIEPEAGKFLKDTVDKTMKEREISKSSREDVIDILIQIKNKVMKENVGLDINLLAAQAMQFFIAGFEATGGTISFVLYELALNPNIQNRVRKEIVCALEKHKRFTYESLQDMPYLDMVISESLRKYPLLPFLDRRCIKDYKIPGTDVVIESGIPVYMSVIGIHRDPEYYPDPEKFDPERFTIENRNARPSSTYMPFGDGPHGCPGGRFGTQVIKTGLVRILSNFAVDRCADTPTSVRFSPSGFVISPKDTLYIRFKKITV